ncbi:DgyrCDS7757 [Dimorphilus gyrociliatus]|uniref:DgyrCDS7757 n=1 Tax=Dimorphilus gyrociliatus TaxID=2664684 RepID=A0A7I8VWY9_9ANNE|nr:DgyrCDS7757 [Dimorphilus gyrociliatus]
MERNSRKNSLRKELAESEVRWFYSEPFKSQEWVSFMGNDSLNLERSYRQFIGDNKEFSKVLVRGNLYEVDLKLKQSSPIFWSKREEDECQIRRGTWFNDNWEPLDEALSDVIEYHHRIYISKNENKVGRFERFKSTVQEVIQGPYTILIDQKKVEWHSEHEVFLIDDQAGAKLIKSLTIKIGLSRAGMKLHRGFIDEASELDRLPEVSHLVLVVHGVGQYMLKKNLTKEGDIIASTLTLKNACSSILQDDLEGKYRIEFLPIQWRNNIELDEDYFSNITPSKPRAVRDAIQSTFIDLLYYMSPIYNLKVLNSLKNEFNRIYKLFSKYNPEFTKKGKISIVAHSLGAVMSYDLLMNWNPSKAFSTYLQQNRTQQTNGKSTKKVGINLYPLISEGFIPPKLCMERDLFPSSAFKNFLNVYHPLDAVAYRIEPLLRDKYKDYKPVKIRNIDEKFCTMLEYNRMPLMRLKRNRKGSTDLSTVTNIKIRRRFKNNDILGINNILRKLKLTKEDNLEKIRKKVDDKQIKLSKNSSSGLRTSKRSFDLPIISCLDAESEVDTFKDEMKDRQEATVAETLGIAGLLGNIHKKSYRKQVEKNSREEFAEENLQNSREKSDSSTESFEEMNRLMKRYDFELKETTLENNLFSPISAVMAHLNYWNNPDLALFILQQLTSDSYIKEQLKNIHKL